MRQLFDLIPMLARASEADAIEQIHVLEQLKAVAAAGQAVAAEHLARMRETAEIERGVEARQRGRGLGGEVALARGEAPHRGDRHLGLAKALVREMPRTLDLMRHGKVSEWRATLVAQETACLSADDRRLVDSRLASDLPSWGDAEVRHHARRFAVELDEEAALLRHQRAKRARRVSVRPLPGPGSMARFAAVLPVAEAVRTYAALVKQAGQVVNAGAAEGRSRSQIAADLLVEHVTGSSSVAAQDVRLIVMMPAESLAGGSEPAWIPGHGPVSAEVARDQLRDASTVWFRRLWTDPAAGGIVQAESSAREFTGQLRALILARDHLCRTPYCGAAIKHIDHITPYAEGGATSIDNSAGLCERCNYAKEHPGWRYRSGAATSADGRGGDGSLDVFTPTGHHYRSVGSPLTYRRRSPGPPLTDERHAELQQRLAARLDAIAQRERERQRRVDAHPGDSGAVVRNLRGDVDGDAPTGGSCDVDESPMRPAPPDAVPA